MFYSVETLILHQRQQLPGIQNSIFFALLMFQWKCVDRGNYYCI